jgi:5-methylcytosine-specific restriction endonuclease McrA
VQQAQLESKLLHIQQHIRSLINAGRRAQLKAGHGGTPKAVKSEVDLCPVCGDLDKLTRHHVIPRYEREQRGLVCEEAEIVCLCWTCHLAAHKLWGSGRRWTGPRTGVEFLHRLKLHRGFTCES